MLPFQRFTLALIISLGLAGSAMAAPIATDLTNPVLATDTLFANATEASVEQAFDIDLNSLNLSYGLQDHGDEFIFLKSDLVKTNLRPIRVPEPNAVLLLTLGLLGLTALRRRKH